MPAILLPNRVPEYTDLPFESWPHTLEGRTVWDAKEMQENPSRWTYQLTEDDIADIDQALQHFQATNKTLAQISPESFPLLALRPRLDAIFDTLVNGFGFTLIRGLPIERYTREEAATVFMGINCHFGPFVTQNAWGHILGHVKDHHNDVKNPAVRLYTTNLRHNFHTDSSDIVSLLCYKRALQGGHSYLASTHAVYNWLRKYRPAALKELARPDLYWDRKVDVDEGHKPYYLSPVFSFYKNRMLGIFDKSYLTTADRHADVPKISQARLDAYEAMLDAANECAIDMELMPGDMQFVHNHQILHARDAYVDSPTDPEYQRHLFRLWVSTGGRGGWPLPAPWGERFVGDLSGEGKRGGLFKDVKAKVVLDSRDLMA